MPLEREELREELLAVLQARQELSGSEEQHLVEGFLAKLDVEIDRRIDGRIGDRLAQMPVRRPRNPVYAAILMLILAIPLTAIAAQAAGLAGIVVIWASILAVIYLVTK